jgi:hypothetical protein
VEERKHVDAVEISKRALQQLLDVAKIATDALGINQDAGTRHLFLLEPRATMRKQFYL